MKKHLITALAALMLFVSAAAFCPEKAAAAGEHRLFQDVTDPEAEYFNAVYWMKAKGITAGYDAPDEGLSFRPDITCTRADFTLLLWRSCGKPSGSGKNPYTDVDASVGAAAYKAILWAAAQGLADNAPDSTFRPSDGIRPEEALIMLWKLEGSPDASVGLPSDYSADPESDAYKALSWAWQEDDSGGFGIGIPGSDETLTRGGAALLLYRYAVKKGRVDDKAKAEINAYRANGDAAPDPSTGLGKYVSLTPGIRIGSGNALYSFPNDDSARFTPKARFGFQNFAFGFTHDGSIPVALLAFNNNYGKIARGDILVAWDMKNNCEYAVCGNLDFDHGNGLAYDPETGTFIVSTGTGDQKAVIGYTVQDGKIAETERHQLASHMSVYNKAYVTSGVVSLGSKGFIAQYAEPKTDDRMFARYDAFSAPPQEADGSGYRHHAYDYTGQSMYTVQVGDRQYLGFLYMTRSYYEEDGSVRYFQQGKADLYDLDDMQYVGTQWFDPVRLEIESASVFNGELYIAYAETNKVHFYRADCSAR